MRDTPVTSSLSCGAHRLRRRQSIDWMRTKAPFEAEYASGWRSESIGKEVGDSTLLDAADESWVSRGRSCREQLTGAAGQRKLDRSMDWALSSPDRGAGDPDKRIMVAV